MKQLNLYYIGGSDQRPEGRTVEPTDDIQIWLKCAGLNKPYTTLAEVLADSSTLEALIADSNAVDYLVRSKSFAKSEALVPTMTSDTTPSGTCFADSATLSNRPAYLAFDGTQDTYWESHSTTSSYVGYQFTSAKKINGIYWKHYTVPNNNHNLVVQGSNDGTNWTNIKTFTNVLQQEYTATFENENSYSYYRVYFNTPTTTSGGGGLYTSVRTLQFYTEEGLTDNATAMSYIGLNNYASNTLLADSTWCSAIWASAYKDSVFNVKVPVMTSDTTPSGVCSASQSFPGWIPYKAFDGDTSTQWGSGSGNPANRSLSYTFPNSVKIYGFEILPYFSNSNAYIKDFEIVDDNANVLYSGRVPNANAIYSDLFASPAESVKFQLNTTSTNYANNYDINIIELQFYGRSDI